MTHSPYILTSVQLPLMELLYDTFSCFLIKHTSSQVSNSYVKISIVFLLQLSYIIAVISYKNYWQKHREANRRIDMPVIINIVTSFNLFKSKRCFTERNFTTIFPISSSAFWRRWGGRKLRIHFMYLVC
jgi:hypothetical protein